MTSSIEQQNLLRDAFEELISTTLDAEEIRRSVLTIAQVLECPTVQKMTLDELGEIFGMSRQAVSKRVARMTDKIHKIKGNCRTYQHAGCHPIPIQQFTAKVNQQ